MLPPKLGSLPPRPSASSRNQDPGAEFARDVFDGFPYALLVVGQDRRVLHTNRPALQLLGDLADGDGEPLRCCDLLGCRSPGPVASACLTQLAFERGGVLPEIRLDLRVAGGASAWVTASRLSGDPPAVLLELRPGDVADRRRRTTPHWLSGAQLRVFTFGRLRVETPEGPIEGRWLEQRPGQLLKFLIAERHRVVSRDEIAEAIWPGADARALGRLRHFVHALRSRLEPDRAARAPSPFVLSTQSGYTIDRSHVAIDADEFEEHAHAGLRHFDADRLASARVHLEHALGLYVGDFLADEPYADWAMAQRDQLRRLADGALRVLVVIARRTGDLVAAAEHLDRLAELDPFDVEVHRELIELCLVRGRRSEALRRYAALRVRILRTFGEELDFTLSDLRGADPLEQVRAQ
jgi:DNA-binding SARP family transcriptional activator